MAQNVRKVANLRLGYPAKQVLEGCSQMLLQASANVLNTPSLEQRMFQYGANNMGPVEFTEEMAKFLTSEYGDTVNSEDLMVTASASQGLHLVVTSLFSKDNPVFVEQKTYYYGTDLFKELGMKTIPVPIDKDGIKTEVFDKMLTDERAKVNHVTSDKTPFWSMAYLIPTFHNPTGLCYSSERCRELIRLARKHRILLMCDDVYNLLYYTDHPPAPRLLSYDNVADEDFCGSVISNCTFTKILAPGIRLGWIETTQPIMTALNKCFLLTSGGCVNQFTAHIVAEALRLGLISDNLKRLRKIYTRRMSKLVIALKRSLPSNCQILVESQGGYFVWVNFPPGLDPVALREEALRDCAVDFLPGTRCCLPEAPSNGIRLSMSVCEEDQIEPGVERLCQAIRDKSHQLGL